MPAKLLSGQGDIADPALRRLIEPDSLRLLEGIPFRDRYLSAVWVKEVPIAAVGARIDNMTRHAEIVSLGCLTDFRDSTALAVAVRQLCGALTGSGIDVAFDPRGPIADHIAANLSAGGMAPEGAEWRWFQFLPEGLSALRASIQPESTPPVCRLSDLAPEQVDVMRTRGKFEPHPDDIGECSPVILGPDQQPIAFLILRRNQPGSVVHWSWVDPQQRRQGLLLVAGDMLFDMLEHNPQAAPVRFRMRVDNKEMRHLVDGAMAGAVQPLFTTRTWKARASDVSHV